MTTVENNGTVGSGEDSEQSLATSPRESTKKPQNDNTWNNGLKKMSWRIDSKNKSRHVADTNELTAIVEMVIEDRADNNKKTKVVRFEMDKEKLGLVLNQVNNIQSQLSKFTT